jgi:hypothetical protein
MMFKASKLQFFLAVSVLIFNAQCGQAKKDSQDQDKKQPIDNATSSDSICGPGYIFFNGTCWYSMEVNSKSVKFTQLGSATVLYLYHEDRIRYSRPFQFDLRNPSDARFIRGSLFLCGWPMAFPTTAKVLEAHCEKKLDAENKYKVQNIDGTLTFTFETATNEISPEERRLIQISFERKTLD